MHIEVLAGVAHTKLFGTCPEDKFHQKTEVRRKVLVGTFLHSRLIPHYSKGSSSSCCCVYSMRGRLLCVTVGLTYLFETRMYPAGVYSRPAREYPKLGHFFVSIPIFVPVHASRSPHFVSAPPHLALTLPSLLPPLMSPPHLAFYPPACWRV